MSISEISSASAPPDRSSARISATAARALGPGAVRIAASSPSVRPLITGAPGATARRSSPSTWPSSSIQCSRAACTSVNGRRSSTRIVTRSGSSRTTSARRISGSAATRAATCTSTAAIANRGDVVTQRAPASSAAVPATISTIAPARRLRRASIRARRARRRARPTRWRATSGVRRPSSASAPAPRGESRLLFTEDADLGLERDPEVAVDALARELHQAQDVGGAGGAAVDDEVGVLGRDLGAVDALAPQAGLLDQARGQLARGILPDEARGGQRQRLRGLLLLEPRADLLLDVRQRAAVQLQPAADEDGALRQVKRAVTEGARRLELAERAVGMQVVDGAHEVADPAVDGAGVHRQRAADGGRDADEALDAAEVQRGRLADERRERHAGAGQRL